jgi:hypothetical protein
LPSARSKAWFANQGYPRKNLGLRQKRDKNYRFWTSRYL